MSVTLFRRPAARVCLVAGAALAACPAFAGDKPATAEGAKTVQTLIDRFLPAPPAGAPSFATVKPDGEGYLVSADLSGFNGLIKAAGAAASYESATLVYKLFEQDDGKWRIVQDSFPKIVAHAEDTTSAVAIDNYKQSLVIDPALAWWLSLSGSADRGVMTLHAPKADQSFEFGHVKADGATTVNGDGSVSSAIKEEVSNIAFKVSAASKDDAPANASGSLDKAAFHIGADGLKSRKLFDLVSLINAHRADLSEHEAELKMLLKELAAPGLKFAEAGEGTKMMIASPFGAITLAGFKLAIGVANQGPQSAIDAAVSAEGLSLPVGLAPPGAADLTPSNVDFAATFKGIDIGAAANEAITDMHLGGPEPGISDEDRAKVFAALVSAGPLRIDIAPSHIVAPAVDADVQGQMRWNAGKASGTATIHMRNFDKTLAALKGLGPDMAAKSIPAVAMAKGLAKTERDGSLSWTVEVGDDRSIKVNGIPLGKAPD